MTRLEQLAVEMAEQKRIWLKAQGSNGDTFVWEQGGPAYRRIQSLTDEIAAEGERLIREREEERARSSAAEGGPGVLPRLACRLRRAAWGAGMTLFDRFFPPAGPCALCGGPDKRHRLIDQLRVEAAQPDQRLGAIARDYALPLKAVLVAILAPAPWEQRAA